MKRKHLCNSPIPNNIQEPIALNPKPTASEKSRTGKHPA